MVDDPVDGASLRRPSLWDSERGSPAVLQDSNDGPDTYSTGPEFETRKEDPGCRGEKGFMYPFKVRLEERYPVKDPASYTDFEKRYPPDRFGEEVSENARVWKLYRDRVTERDEDQIEGWNKTLDILLIFAGLFSAVATAVIIEAYKQLQPDHNEILVKALIASLNGTAVAEPANFSPLSRSALVRGVNTLWFLSLTLALIVALLAILAKQWLSEYTSRMRRHISSQRRWAWRHLVYHTGLEKWGMDAFISTLPLLLHLSLLLFLLGLVAFLADLDWVIVVLVLPLTIAVIVFYVGATVAPLWFGDCPSATPLLHQGRRALEFLQNHARRRMFSLQTSISLRFRVPFTPTFWKPPAYDEDILLEGGPACRDATVVRWMVNSLPAVEEVEVALDAVGSLDPLEHRHEFHQISTGFDDGPIEGDTLCLGPVLVAATARFRRLCEGATSDDPVVIARCIRTLLALSIDRLRTLNLPPSHTIAARASLSRWAAIPSYDLHLLCNTFLAWNNSQCMRIRDAALAWTDDAGPGTGETPYLSSSIALSFLRCEPYTTNAAIAMGLIYSTLSGPLAASVLVPTQRTAASTILHDAASASMQGLSNGTLIVPFCAMYTPQQLHFRAISTVGALWRFSSDHAPPDMRRSLATKFAHLISTSPGVETLTLEHLPYARSILDILPLLGPESGDIPLRLLELIGSYLCQLQHWSKDAGEMTHRIIGMYASPASGLRGVELAASLAFQLSSSSHDLPESSDVFLRHSLVNLLHSGTQGEQSVWRMLCNTAPRGIYAEYLIRFASVLGRYLTFLQRRGADVIDLVEEYLGDGRLYNIIYATSFHWSTAHVAQHARELSPSWWKGTRARFLSLADSQDVEHVVISLPSIPSWLAVVANGGSIAVPVMLIGLVQEIDAREACHACPNPIRFDLAAHAQDTAGNQHRDETSLVVSSYRRTCTMITRMIRRGRTMVAPEAAEQNLPVAVPPSKRHASQEGSAQRPSGESGA